MGIAAQAKGISTGIQHIALVRLIIVRCHVIIIHGHAHGLALARLEQISFCKSAQNNRRFFNSTGGIGCGVIQLYHIFACHITGIGYLNTYLYLAALAAYFPLRVAPIKRGIAQAIAKGILNSFLILCFFLRGINIVIPNVTGLVIAITYIDAFLVVHVLAVVGIAIAVDRKTTVCISKIAKVFISWRTGHIISIGINQMAGRVVFTHHCFRYSNRTSGARAACPNCSIHLVVLNKAKVHRIACVNDNDDLIKRCFQLCQQFFFCRLQLQVMPPGFTTVITGHIQRAVTAFACHTSDYINRHIRVSLCILPERCAVLIIFGQCFFINVKVCITDRHACHRSALLRSRLVELRQIRVQLQTSKFKTINKVKILIFIMVAAGAIIGVNRLVAVIAEQIDFVRSQRQGIIIVFQQHKTFALYFLAKL